MKKNQLTEIIIGRQRSIQVMDFLSLRVSLVCIAATLCLVGTGCESYNIDPAFSKTHDLTFKQPPTQGRAVILYQHKGKDPFGKEKFLEAVKNTGAFSEVAVAEKEKDLEKYPGWDVIRVHLTDLGAINSSLVSAHENFQVNIRFEFQTPGIPAEYVYSSSLWHTALGANPPPSFDAPPLTASEIAGFPSRSKLKKLENQFAQAVVLAAFSEAQRSGRYFQ
jgi:hypothetical protein